MTLSTNDGATVVDEGTPDVGDLVVESGLAELEQGEQLRPDDSVVCLFGQYRLFEI